jgi:pyridoxal phosphate enzyme (YggS family)
MNLSRNLAAIKARIGEAASASGRSLQQIRLVAVSKTVDSSVIQAMYELGQRDFAENRPQVLRDKARELSQLQIEWHFIGPLQSNKIKYVYPVATLVHSVDRVELIDEFVSWHKKTGRRCPFLLEVHISDETSKQGFACDEVLDIISHYRDSEHLDIRGMMGMAPFVDDPAVVRGCFHKLAELFEASRSLEGRAYHACELSMGMSGDFPLAIAEGATMIRIGTALFAGEES